MKFQKQQGTSEIIFILALILTIFFILGMVLGDNQRVALLKSASSLQGQAYEGFGPTRITRARTKSRSLKNFDDARIRQDQYNRKHEPMKTRKRGGIRP